MQLSVCGLQFNRPAKDAYSITIRFCFFKKGRIPEQQACIVLVQVDRLLCISSSLPYIACLLIYVCHSEQGVFIIALQLKHLCIIITRLFRIAPVCAQSCYIKEFLECILDKVFLYEGFCDLVPERYIKRLQGQHLRHQAKLRLLLRRRHQPHLLQLLLQLLLQHFLMQHFLMQLLYFLPLVSPSV